MFLSRIVVVVVLIYMKVLCAHSVHVQRTDDVIQACSIACLCSRVAFAASQGFFVYHIDM